MSSVVAVVGGGLAGLAATTSLLSSCSSVSVVLLEKEGNVGGNSAKATSGINGCSTILQQKLGLTEDNTKLFFEDTNKSGDNMGDPALITVLTKESADAIEWLMSKGAALDDVRKLGGHSAPRTHRFGPDSKGKSLPVGFTLIKVLRNVCDEFVKENRLTIITGAEVRALKTEKKQDQIKVVGLEYTKDDKSVALMTSALILATGGYGNDHEQDSLLSEFAADKANLATTNGAFASGQGVKMARKIGAKLTQMDQIQIHPTGFVDRKEPNSKTKFLAPEMLRGCGAIMVDCNGSRFVNELERRDVIVEAMERKCDFDEAAEGKVATLIMNDLSVDTFGRGAIDFYTMKGFFEKFDNAKSAMDKLGLKNLEKTLIKYNDFAGEGKDEFGKMSFPSIPIDPHQPLYVACVTPVIHYTMGGLAVDASARVLATSDAPVEALFAAGEVSGGLHGHNRLAGNSLLECVVFGRIAAQTALNYLNKK